MPKQVMERRAADNAYLHKDFHSALNCGLIYLHQRFGEAAVRHYLQQFARSWYGPLRQRLQTEGLPALRRHFEAVYATEQGEVRFEESRDELVLHVAACPAVQHIRARGEAVSSLFIETTRTVNEALCEGTPYAAELLSYEAETGRSTQRFRRRSP